MENIFQPFIVYAYFTASHRGAGLNSEVTPLLPVSDHRVWGFFLASKMAGQRATRYRRRTRLSLHCLHDRV